MKRDDTGSCDLSIGEGESEEEREGDVIDRG